MEFYILITQYDMDATGICSRPPVGPLVHESKLMNHQEAMQRARQMAGRYGWCVVAPVEIEGLEPTPEKKEEPESVSF